jgi:hypothetical protein
MAMSLLRNFSPGGSEPDDDEQPTTAEEPTSAERAASAEYPDETAARGAAQAPGAARYAFTAPPTAASGASPAPATVVPSEVVTEPDLAEQPDPAEEPRLAEEAVAKPVFEAPGAAVTPPALETPGPGATPAPDFEERGSATTPVPTFQPRPAPVPSLRATGEDGSAAQVAPVTEPDFAAPLLSGTAELRARWQRVQGDFVDDPQAAVSDADDLVGQTAEALVNAVRQRQRQLRAAWERSPAGASPAAADGQTPTAMAPGAPDTEQLRLMMQRYRALFNELCRPS